MTQAYIVFEGEAEKRHGSFEDYFYDQCSIYASELVGPNAYEWDSIVDRLREDDVYREACLIKFNMEFRS